MARRTRGRRPRVVWLPQDPFFSVDSSGLGHSTLMSAVDTLAGSTTAGETVTIVAPCVRDVPINPLTAGSTLADIENSGYRLRRIVGKIWVGYITRGVEPTPPALVCCTAGFIVLRCDDQGIPLAPTGNDNYNTLIIENTENPWIWRRSWLVGNPNGAAGSIINSQSGTTPGFINNLTLGGNSDGPHVDAKTARIVGPDERLFLVLSTMTIDVGDNGIAGQVQWLWDCRYLASMRSMVGNRRNASR